MYNSIEYNAIVIKYYYYGINVHEEIICAISSTGYTHKRYNIHLLGRYDGRLIMARCPSGERDQREKRSSYKYIYMVYYILYIYMLLLRGWCDGYAED